MAKKGEKGGIPWWIKVGKPNPFTTPSARKRISESRRMREPWNKGKHYIIPKARGIKRPWSRESLLKRWANPVEREKQRTRFLKNNPSKCGEESPHWVPRISRICPECQKEFMVISLGRRSKQFCSIQCCGRYKMRVLNGDAEFQFKRLRGLKLKPTKPDIQFINIVKKYGLPYKFVGDGQFLVGQLNPDFISVEDDRIAVDIFGDYWHSPLFRPEINSSYTYFDRIKIFRTYGWKLIVIWESDLANERIVLKKLGIEEVKADMEKITAILQGKSLDA